MSMRFLPVFGISIFAAATIGCSEPVPPASQGAFVAAFQAPGMCGKDIHNSQIGYADATEIRDLKKNGVGGAQIFCAVSGSGSTFDIEAELNLFSTTLRINLDGVSTSATVDQPAAGTVTYQTQETIKPYTSPADIPCNFWFENQQEVAAGRIWSQFSCERIDDAGTNTQCALGISTFAMQNCDQ